MHRSDWESVLSVIAPVALEYLGSLPTRRVHPHAGYPEVKAALDHPCSVTSADASDLSLTAALGTALVDQRR